MRLGQLARKINKSTSDICEYMDKEMGVEINTHPNSKIDDQYLDQITEYFIPPENIEKEVEVGIAEATETVEDIISEAEKKEEVVVNQEVEQGVEPTLDQVSKAETIKASAAKLEGFKVIGKIDLPPPPPVEMVEIDGVMYEREFIRQQRREEKEEKRKAELKRKQERLKNRKENVRPADKLTARSLTFAEIKENETKQVENKKVEEEKRRKARQHKHYHSNKDIDKKIAPKKIVKKEKIVIEEAVKKVDPNPPKSLLGKFWRWLNTY